jgi:hypothetical protein
MISLDKNKSPATKGLASSPASKRLGTYPDEAVVEDEADERGAVLAVGHDGLGHVVLDHVLHATALAVVVTHLEVASSHRRRRLHRQHRRAQRRHQRHQHLHLLLDRFPEPSLLSVRARWLALRISRLVGGARCVQW